MRLRHIAPLTLAVMLAVGVKQDGTPHYIYGEAPSIEICEMHMAVLETIPPHESWARAEVGCFENLEQAMQWAYEFINNQPNEIGI